MKKERYDIPMRQPCSEFIDAYNAMGRHFNEVRKSMPESLSFLRTQPVPPMIDHLSFKIGNQIFFVYMDPVDDSVEPVSNLDAMIEHYVFRSRNAFFASDGAPNNEDPFDPDAHDNRNFLPLYRGGGTLIRFQGLVRLLRTSSH